MHYLVWTLVAVALAVAEIFTAGFFLIFFGLGAAITAIFSLFVPGIVPQLVIFLVSSMVLVLFARPILKNTLNIQDTPAKSSNVAMLIGKDVLVLDTVTRYGGRVRLLHSGEVWSAYLDGAEPEESLPEGQEGLVSRVDGAKLVIRPKAATSPSSQEVTTE